MLAHAVLLPPLALLISASHAINLQDITTTNLTAQYFPELGARRTKVSYGSFDVQPRHEGDGMSHFESPIPPPCTNCLVTFMQAQLEYPNGTTADATTGMWMHHVVFLNQGQRDSVCSEMPAQRFFASGNERTAVDFTASGTQYLGYLISANETLYVFGELMNMLDAPQEVVLSMVWEFVPSQSPYSKHAIPYWLDVGGCGDSHIPAKAKAHFKYDSPVLEAPVRADIALIAGHLHDGGTHVDVLRDDQVVCTSKASYEADGASTNHIAQMTTCWDVGKVNPGEQWHIKAYYDTITHPPMSANDGSLEPVMGIALAYLVATEPLRVGLLSRSTLIYVVVLVVIGTGLAGLYVARQKPDLAHRLSDRWLYRGWQRVRASDPDQDTEDGHLLNDHDGSK